MIGLHALYCLTGLIFAAFALLSLFDRSNRKRLGNAAFWGLLAASFLAGDRFGDFGNGLLVLALVALGGFGSWAGAAEATTTSSDEAALARARQLAVPARADHSGRRRSPGRALQVYALRRAPAGSIRSRSP